MCPTGTRKTKCQENANFISSVTMCIESKTTERNLKEQLSKFWETENVGIGETKSVYYNFESTIKFDGSRYVTSLPFKPHHQFLPDNYSIAKYRL